MNLKGTIIKVIICLVLTWAGWQLSDMGLTSPSKKNKTMYEQLCKNGLKTKGRIADDYEHSTLKLIRGSKATDMNTFKYVYTVNGRDYHDKFTVNTMPKGKEIDVWYDPNDPTVHFTHNPCAQLEYYKGKDHPLWYAFIGVPMLLVGAGTLYSMFKNGLRSLFTPKSRR